MPLLFIAVALALVSTILGGLGWTILRLFGFRSHLRATLKWSGIGYLALLPLVVFVVLPLAASHLLAHASTRPMDRHLVEDPASYGRPWEEVSFSSVDGILLRGWYLPGDPGRTPFVFSHGLFRDRHEVLERSCRLNGRGFPGLVFDFRGHGQSDEATITLGYREQSDVIAAAEYLKTRTQASKVALCGVSMGAVATVLAASRIPDQVQSLIADSPFSTLEKTVERHAGLLLGIPGLPFSRLFLWNFSRIGHFSSNSVDVLQASARLGSVPTLLIYGREDRRMPPPVAEEIFGSIPGTSNRLIFIEGADHGAAYTQSPEVYLDAVEEFLSRKAQQ
jgi:pimeloyl-ACP methyl ester carboxylesterase